ncbi:MAG TPA: potassium-transporting ATPase subunit KdpA, partial [Candidatus Margulisiibacteriota bacterium]|nr:potassium-transporting ATPase subunit KdpA [Candidatus Margulisiibacteriota bacterium]
MWFLPFSLLVVTIGLAIPLGLFMNWIFDGHYTPPAWLRRVEGWFDTGPQNWKEYCKAFLLFNAATFVVGFVVMALQPYLPLNPDLKGMLSPTTILHSVVSFM